MTFNKLIFIWILVVSNLTLCFSQAENSNNPDLIILKNYKEWNSNPTIVKYLESNPELKTFLDYSYIKALQRENQRLDTSGVFNSLLEKSVSSTASLITTEAIKSIEKAYWSIINSPAKDDLSNVIINEMNRFREQLKNEIEKMPKPPR